MLSIDSGLSAFPPQSSVDLGTADKENEMDLQLGRAACHIPPLMPKLTSDSESSNLSAQEEASPSDDSETGPNGLPYALCPPAYNEWCKYSEFLAWLPADPVRSMHPAIVCLPRTGGDGGMGLYCCNGLAKGEVVWAERKEAGDFSELDNAVPRSREWIEALPPASKKIYCRYMHKTGEDEFQSLAEFNEMPIEEYPNVRIIDISNYMNHSCSPTCWFVDGGEEYTKVMVAARDLAPGDEVTYDFCTAEDCELSPEWECHCGSANCRGLVTPRDWQLPALQQQYAGHFLPHIAEKISCEPPADQVPTGSATADSDAADAASTRPMARLEEVDTSKSWWLANLDSRATPIPGAAITNLAGRPDRLDMMQHVATGLSLDLLNRQAAMLIIKHQLKWNENDDVGGFVETGAAIGAGELVMMLLPRSDCL